MNISAEDNGTVIEFLLGEKSLDGVWFGDKHPKLAAPFWWRKHLRNCASIKEVKPDSYSFNQIAPLIAALGQITHGKSAAMSSFNKELSISDMSAMAKEALEEFHKKGGEVKPLEEDKISKAIENLTDTELLDWLQEMMLYDDNYCEIYFAGLRNGAGKASDFQIESNPEKFKTVSGKNIREAIKKAMNEANNNLHS